jgi:hypothetical protein
MKLQEQSKAYLFRLILNCVLVGGGCLTIAFAEGFEQALWAPWFLLGLVLDAMVPGWNGGLREWPLALLAACATASILALCAKSRIASILAVLWFLLNILNVFSFMSVYDGHS